jgi:hypothetical protein
MEKSPGVGWNGFTLKPELELLDIKQVVRTENWVFDEGVKYPAKVSKLV